MRIASFFFIAAIILTISNARLAIAQTIIKKLPYIEADSELDSNDGSELLIWAAPDKVLFGTYRNSHFSQSKYCDNDQPRKDCAKPTFDRTKILMLYDAASNKTIFNIKNQFHKRQVIAFEQHQSYTYRQCPEDKNGPSKPEFRIRYVRLKSGDGCVKEEWTQATKPSYISYISADGKQTSLNDDTEKSNLRFWAWIDWLNVYVLGTSISSISTTDGSGTRDISPTAARLLTLNGKLEFVEMPEKNLSSIRPTRAGIVATARQGGISLWRNGNRYIVVEGGYIQKLEVSPNGCQVAYLAPRRIDEMRNGFLQEITYSKLRVIDLCKGFKVPKNANPFAKLLK